MIDKLISSILAFFLFLIPSSHVSKPQTTILFTGDIMLGRSVMGATLDNNDPFYSFKKTADLLKSADITFVNLENPIVKDCKRHVGGFTFCTTPEIAKGLNFAGIDVVTLANNHSGNYGKEGLEETKTYLSEMGIDYVGENNLVIKEINGTKFGFLGFNYTFGYSSLDSYLAQIARSDLVIDILIVGVHWGEEYRSIANSL